MTNRPRSKRTGAAARKSPRDPIDDFVDTAALALDLKIEPAWLPAVRENLRVILYLGANMSKIQLPDDAEPAPVFRA